ncbi:hypothetical protein Taro_033786 [Colocasia esculenta]|uniref:Uncharacterized protein n=1 Tax=Colocasia esculenta TaxID=4460 RepID=A0A843W2E6_COLES|nr:hypothetical protein [Colocasia esculenta]
MVFWELSLVSTLPELVSTLLDLFAFLDPLHVLSDQALIPIVTTREPDPRPTPRTRFSWSPPTDQGDPEGL